MITKQFESILIKETEAEYIPFLQELTKEDKKVLSSALKAFSKEYLEYREINSLIGGTSYGQKATPRQASFLYGAGFVCLNKKEYQKLDQFGHFLGNELIEKILSWYCPDWFSDVVNDLTKRGWLPFNFDYDYAMRLADAGYLNPSDELISRLIPQMIFRRDANHKFDYVPEVLEKRSVTLDRHIWLVFQLETSIHLSDRYLHFQNSTKDFPHWMEALKSYVLKGRIDRQQLLKECLLASNRNFNKTLSGWFVEFFEFLEPVRADLVMLQPELLNILTSKHSKVVNTSLNALKDIADENQFNSRDFVDHIPILLSSDTKSVVTRSLSLLEKVMKKHPEFTVEICIGICQAFIHNDEEIQSRAGKLLVKYNKKKDPSIATELDRYADSMLMSSKKLLEELISVSKPDELKPTSHVSSQRNGIQLLEEVHTFDELVFLASQSFDNNDSLHIDLFPSALINLQQQIDGGQLHKFEPALQRAYSIVMNDWSSTMGYLDHLLATFFIDVTKIWIERFPADGVSLQKIHNTFRKKDEENKAKWKWYHSRILELATWAIQSRDNTYIIHKAILLFAYDRLKNNLSLSLLSTPTYQNATIDPVTLIRRIHTYQGRGSAMDNYDFQLAISRIGNSNYENGLKVARELLRDEPLRIMEFLLDAEARPVAPFTTPSLWFMAAVRKSPGKIFSELNSLYYSSLPRTTFTGEVPWKSFTEHYTAHRYDYVKKKPEPVDAQHNVLRLTLNPVPIIWQIPEEEKPGLLSKLKQFVTAPKKDTRTDTYLLYEYLSLKAQFLSAEHNDIQRFLYLFPGNPNPLLALVTSKSLDHGTFGSETDKRMVTKVLETLNNLDYEFTDMTFLFVATCLVTSDKTVRSFAAESWITSVNRNKIDNARIGEIVGIHLASGYAPIKRFTDVLSENMLKISSAHNVALETLVTAVIEQLPGEAPTGVKRLLEIYSEILLLNNASVNSTKVKQILNQWSSSANLKKIVNALIK